MMKFEGLLFYCLWFKVCFEVFHVKCPGVADDVHNSSKQPPWNTRLTGQVRQHPLVKTSSKSNLGHTEISAGNSPCPWQLMALPCHETWQQGRDQRPYEVCLDGRQLSELFLAGVWWKKNCICTGCTSVLKALFLLFRTWFKACCRAATLLLPPTCTWGMPLLKRDRYDKLQNETNRTFPALLENFYVCRLQGCWILTLMTLSGCKVVKFFEFWFQQTSAVETWDSQSMRLILCTSPLSTWTRGRILTAWKLRCLTGSFWQHQETGFFGVSSFGFGGSNAWSLASWGSNENCKIAPKPISNLSQRWTIVWTLLVGHLMQSPRPECRTYAECGNHNTCLACPSCTKACWLLWLFARLAHSHSRPTHYFAMQVVMFCAVPRLVVTFGFQTYTSSCVNWIWLAVNGGCLMKYTVC